jgi:hypothetical protein
MYADDQGRSVPSSRSRRRLIAATLGFLVLYAISLGASSALAQGGGASGVWWHLASSSAPRNLVPGQEAQILITASDLGYQDAIGSAAHPIEISAKLPANLEVVPGSVEAFTGNGVGRPRGGTSEPGNGILDCPTQGQGQLIGCVLPEDLPTYQGIEMIAYVRVAAGVSAPSTETDEVGVSGGENFEAALARDALQIDDAPTGFGVDHYELVPENIDGTPDTSAGSHPFQLTTTFDLDQDLIYDEHGKRTEGDGPVLSRNLHFVLPPGLLGNVTIVPECSEGDFFTLGEGDTNDCPRDTAIGVARVTIYEPNDYGGVVTETVPVFNLKPAVGEPARFGIELAKVQIELTTAVRTGSNYAVEVTVHEITQAATLLQSQLTFWGVPGASQHDKARGWQCIDNDRYREDTHEACPAKAEEEAAASGAAEQPPFLTLPTSCTQADVTSVTGESWPTGGARTVYKIEEGAENTEYTMPALESGSCALEGFAPAIAVTSESSAASTPTGMGVEVSVPQGGTLSEAGPANADIKETVLQLPEGVEASPAAAGGLLACTGAEFGLGDGVSESLGTLTANDNFNADAANCPPQAKIGTVSIKTPLLKDELTGSVYLASQDTSPFTSPLVLYLFAEDKTSGVKVKLAGEVQINHNNGQLTSYFKETPPVPFESLHLNLFGGGRASESTPSTCGEKTADATFKPDSGTEPVSADSSFQITSGPEGTPCPSGALPFGPSVSAGPTSNGAGEFTNFTMTLGHPDADQAITGLTVHLPAGNAAILRSVTPCPIEQAKRAECGEESLVGNATTVTGLGDEPFQLPGRVYLTGPYDNAPFGLSVAIAAEHVGPFNIGTVISNSTIEVNKETAAVTVTARETMVREPDGHEVTPDEREASQETPLPTMIKGIPVQLKELHVEVNRANFEFNPTHCSGVSPVTGTLSGAEGGSSGFESPYEVDNCASLPFNPGLTITTGNTYDRVDGTFFDVKVTAKPGEANIGKTKLVIPADIPSRLSTIQKACPEKLFNANPATCDEGSVIGEGIVHTPVLKNTLTGPAYLVSHGGAEFPDVEFVLHGEGIELILDGKTKIVHSVTTSSFESVPDAPVETFEADLPAGPHSALSVYLPKSGETLCTKKTIVATTITGQNGVVLQRETPVLHKGCVLSFSKESKLAKALKACKAKYKKKKKREQCEATARKKYGSKKKSSKKKKKSSKKK